MLERLCLLLVAEQWIDNRSHLAALIDWYTLLRGAELSGYLDALGIYAPSAADPSCGPTLPVYQHPTLRRCGIPSARGRERTGTVGKSFDVGVDRIRCVSPRMIGVADVSRSLAHGA
jgi:hypothetical protein